MHLIRDIPKEITPSIDAWPGITIENDPGFNKEGFGGIEGARD